ncbi:hypothetical protein [Francisella tularensis]|uniref:hypothetical protein n=1 Tax=Francisella tularensis TaxID=263 RepID=UPI001C0F0CAE|nr:hypothetical protein [Francisella tularensis]MBK2243054.1 hypothetical protein [Francisella tularensis]
MKKTLITIVILTSVGAATNASAEVTNKKFLTATGTNIQYGDAYSTDSARIAKLTCFEPAVPPMTQAPVEKLSFSQSMTKQELAKDLNVDISSSGGFGLFSADASATYVNSLKDGSTAMTFSYVYSITAESVINSVKLSPQGEQELKYPEKFRENCGDQVFKDFQLGSKLIATLSMDFHSEEQKQAFQAKVGASFGIFGTIDSKVQQEINDAKISGTVSINVYQIGGDPTKLANIFGEPDENGIYKATSCNLNDLSACNSAIGNIITYAKGEYQNSLDNAFANNDQSKLKLLLGDRDDYFDLHSVIGIEPGTDIPEVKNIDQIKQARERMVSAYLANKYYVDKANKIFKTYPVTLDDSYKIALGQFMDKAQANVNLIQEKIVKNCYNNLQNCPSVASQVLTSSNPNAITEDLVDKINAPIKYAYRGYLTDYGPISSEDVNNVFYSTGNPMYWALIILVEMKSLDLV